MAEKRDTNSGYTQKTRDRIQASGLIERLINHALGEKNEDGSDLMTQSQVNAAIKLVNKVVPDLKAIEHKGEISHKVVEFKQPSWLK